MKFTVCVTAHNEGDEPLHTLRSLRATAVDAQDVILVDDASSLPIKLTPDCGQCKVIRTQRRIGVGPARHLAATHALTEHILFIDAHSRFAPGWCEAALQYQGGPSTVVCGTCLGLGFNGTRVMNMDVTNPNAEYHGATWNIFGPDRKPPHANQIFECVWAPKREDDDYELSGCMGACYIVPREWYIKLNCGRNLVSYGCDEQELALKTWLAGGEVRMLKGVRIGHQFKEAKKAAVMGRLPYNATHYVVRNKIFLILTLLPQQYADILLSKLRHERDFHQAMRAVEADWANVECERARNAKLFTRDFPWFLSHFGLSFPAK